MNSVFAELNRGEAVTKGLRKVDKSQMTHKNPSLRTTAIVKETKPNTSTAINKSATTQVRRPPRKELEGTKWVVENYVDDAEIVLDEVSLNHSVYIYNCKNSTVRVHGKFNAVTLDGCNKTGLVLDTLVSAVELVKSNSFALQILDKCPTILCDSCDSGQIYLATSGLECEILTSKSSSINVNVPGDQGDFEEQAVPEMLKHVVVGGKLTTSIVEHHG